MRVLRLLLALLTFGLGPSALAQQLLYIHTDHLNTPRMVTDGTGTPVWRWDQIEPFGDNPPDEDPDGNGGLGHMPLRFPGQYFDKETNLHYNMARDYSPEIGRYVQSDPIGLAAGINTYAYVGGNPIGKTDPSGLFDPTGFGVTAATGTALSPAVMLVGAVGLALLPSSLADGTLGPVNQQPPANDANYCPPDEDEDDYCTTIYKGLKGVYDDIVSGKIKPTDLAKQAYRNSRKKYQNRCVPKGYPPLPPL